MQAIGYIRVSTEEQARSGVSLDAQEAAIRAYCMMRQLELVDVVIDAGISGSVPLGDRPGGSTVLSAIEKGSVEAVVAVKLDRLFRDACDCLNVTGQWDRLDVSLHLVDMGGQAIDTSSAMGRFMLTVLAGCAEMERNLTRERITAALQHKRAQGQRTGSIPYVWELDADGVHLVPVPAEQKVITEIRRLRDAGLTLRGIARELATLGFTTRKSKQWHPQQVKRVIEFVPPGSSAA